MGRGTMMPPRMPPSFFGVFGRQFDKRSDVFGLPDGGVFLFFYCHRLHVILAEGICSSFIAKNQGIPFLLFRGGGKLFQDFYCVLYLLLIYNPKYRRSILVVTCSNYRFYYKGG